MYKQRRLLETGNFGFRKQRNCTIRVVKTKRTYQLLSHCRYKNMPMQYTVIFKVVKYENFPSKVFDIYLIFAQNINCGYMLKPAQRGGFNEYPQTMF